ncbi:hypothetical protein AC244_21755 [Ensifer adhaerens]|uniref:DUF2924 domain-containing protein n=1 Tax=Ensifer adhaerens TaxID=106592 RepID=A0A0L8BN68_ENSAD|nr:hypothetical protein [Ensifer adhaerens]KOF16033.1 hypothetical protein AC244_21755 [Ensifer adhaerens]
MSEVQTIDIDFDVHKRIEAERQSFAETPNAVLRRLLGIDGRTTMVDTAPSSGRPWAGKGVTLPHGTKLRMEYNGRVHSGVIQNGAWNIEGGMYQSPSAAAGGVARTKDGKKTNLDGWIYWQVKRPEDAHWIALGSLRKPREPEIPLAEMF